MRKVLYGSGVVIAVLVGGLLLAAHIGQNIRIRVGTDPNLPPFEYFGGQDGDEIIGFDIDIARAIVRNANRRIEITHISFDQLLSAIEDGDVDFAIAAMPITTERIERVAFSRPYYIATQAVVTRSNAGRLRSLSDLENARIGVRAETVGETVVAEFPFPNTVLAFRSENEMIEALLADQIDAAISDREVGDYHVAARNGEVMVSDIGSDSVRYGIAVRKGNTRLLGIINRTITSVRDGDEYRMLLERHVIF